MQPSTRYVLAVLVGLVAGSVSYVLIRPDFEVGPVLFASGVNAVVWTAAVGVYLPVYERFDGPPAGADDLGAAAAKWGGIAGGAASLSVSGTAVVLMPQSPSLRYVAVVGGFDFGAVLLHTLIGMRLVAVRVRGG
jgi:hypothetical protein